MANTTSPSSDQITASTHLQLVDTISDLYSLGVFPSFPCAQSLFLEIIRINYLRQKMQNHAASLTSDSTNASILGILERIDSFSPESWLRSSSASHAKEGLLIAQTFQSAVALFALTSLPWPLDTTPTATPGFGQRTMRSHHRTRLFSLLGAATESPVLKNTVAWPLVVAGVVAAAGAQDERVFVKKHLSEMSRDTGNASPLVAIGILERFWAIGKAQWDDCFDKPYAIVS